MGEEGLINRGDGKSTDWKGRYKLRHNWSRGVCEVREIRLKEERLRGGRVLVRMAEGVVLTVDVGNGLRGWDLKGRGLISGFELGEGEVPTCLAVDEQDGGAGGLGVAVGFENGGWRTWRLDLTEQKFVEGHRHPASSNGTLSAVAYSYPYLLTITEEQLLSLYSFTPIVPEAETEPLSPSKHNEEAEEIERALSLDREPSPIPPTHQEDQVPPPSDQPDTPRLLASLKSHTSWPPLSLSIRTTPTTLIASIAYTLRTYTSGYTVGLQELHLSLTTGSVKFSRLTSALPQGFTSILAPSSSPSSASNSENSTSPAGTSRSETSCPTSLSYSHPYILATHPDNTLTLYLCTSTASTLSITSGTKLWGHTSSVSSAEITPRGKAVSVSTRGNELRVWELEGGLGGSSTSSSGLSSSLRKRGRAGVEKSVVVRPAANRDEKYFSDFKNEKKSLDFVIGEDDDDMEGCRRWVGFDDEVVIVLKESGGGAGRQALMVYDFT